MSDLAGGVVALLVVQREEQRFALQALHIEVARQVQRLELTPRLKIDFFSPLSRLCSLLPESKDT